MEPVSRHPLRTSERLAEDCTARRRLATNVRILRLLRNWSQEALSEAANLDRGYIGGIERAERNVSLEAMERIAEAFGVTIGELLESLDPKAIGEGLLSQVQTSIIGKSNSG